MKVTFKDLKQQKFSLNFEPTQPISEVKLRLAEEKGWDASDQKLIYSGKILKDDQTLKSYNIEEKGYIVCMIAKPKTSKKEGSSTDEPVVQHDTAAALLQPSAPIAGLTAAAIPSNSTSLTTHQPQGTDSPQLNVPTSLLTTTQHNEVIANLEAMGFERSQIDLALRAAFFNPDRAVEYLLNGIPDNVQAPPRPSPGAAVATTAAATNSGPTTATAVDGATHDAGEVNLFDLAAAAQHNRGTTGSDAPSPTAAAGNLRNSLGALDFLRDHTRFQELRQIVQQNPQMLETLLQQIGAGNPDLASLIAQNPDQFLQILGEDGEDDVPAPHGTLVVSVTEEERDAIERLCRLGFDRDEATQAYFACDKNEEMAANFLFDQPPDRDMPPPPQG